jgi:hypothetical protein
MAVSNLLLISRIQTNEKLILFSNYSIGKSKLTTSNKKKTPRTSHCQIKIKQDVARYVVLRIPPLVHL